MRGRCDARPAGESCCLTLQGVRLDYRQRSTPLRTFAVNVGGFAARHPWFTLAWVTAATLLLAPAAARIDYSDDVLSFLPEGDTQVAEFRALGKRFGGLSIGLIGVQAPDGDLFTSERLNLIRKVTKSVRTVKGVAHSTSVTELRDITVIEEHGEESTVVSDLISAIPEGPADLRALKTRVLARDHVRGMLVAPDGATSLILVNLAPDVDAKKVADAIRAKADKLLEASGGALRFHYGGAPFIGSYVATMARADIAGLSPWVAIAIVLIVLVTARSLLGALIALGSVGLAIVWVIGFISLAGRPLTLVSSSLPMLLMALGSAYSIHLLAKILGNLDAEVQAPTGLDALGLGRLSAVTQALEEVGPPILVAGITTCLGFLSFLVMDIEPMREFGVCMAAGTALVVFLGLVVVSACAVLLPLKGRRGGRAPAWAVTLMTTSARFVSARPGVALFALIAVSAGAATMVSILPGAMSMRAFFAEGSEPVAAEDFLEQKLGGSVFLQVEMAGPMKDPLALRQLERLGATVSRHPAVTGVQSVIIPVLLAARGLTGEGRVPASEQASRAIGTLISEDPNIGLLVDHDWAHALIQIKIQGASGAEALALAHQLQADGARLGGKWAAMARGKMSPEQEALERKLVVDHLSSVLGPVPGLDAALQGNGGTLDAKQVEARLKSDIVDDELLFLKEGAELRPVSQVIAKDLRRMSPKNLAGLLEPLVVPEELEDRESYTKAAGIILSNLVGGLRAERTKARVERVAKLLPQGGKIDRAFLTRSLAVLDDPWAGLPAAQASDAARSVDLKVTVSGNPLVYDGMNRSVQSNQINSLFASLLLVVLTLSFFFRSLIVGLAATVPAAFTLLLVFAVMGLLRIPMDVGTSMVASIALGVGIDYAVHLVWRHGLPSAEDAERVLTESLTATGWGIVINALEVTVGFGLLVFGTLVPTQNVGLLTATAMVLSAGASLVLLPALLRGAAMTGKREK